jgi:hypothetical protein
MTDDRPAQTTYQRFQSVFEMRPKRVAVVLGADESNASRWERGASMVGASERIATALTNLVEEATPEAAWHIQDLVRTASCMGGLPMLLRLLFEDYLAGRVGGAWRKKRIGPS